MLYFQYWFYQQDLDFYFLADLAPDNLLFGKAIDEEEYSQVNYATHEPSFKDLNGNIIEILNPTQADAIMQSVLTIGQIADGEYTFEVVILSENDQVLASDSRTFLVQSPASITLESPGGALSDTLDNIVYSTFPIFQWFNVCVYINIIKNI